MFWLALVGVGLAAGPPTGWQETSREGGCVFYKGSPEGDALPIRADCRWDVPAEDLHTLLSSYDYDFFSGCSENAVIGTQGTTTRIFQRHRFSGLSDRTVFLDYSTAPIQGGTRYAWTKSDDQSGLPTDTVEIALDTGSWDVTDDPMGVRIVYELRYAAGGNLPGFLVRWFQGAGTRQTMADLRAAAERRIP